MSTDDHVILYNINSGAKQLVVNRGAGPLEMAAVSSLSTDEDGKLWLSGMRDGKVISAEWNPNGDQAIINLAFKTQDDMMRGVTDGKGGLIALPVTPKSIRAVHLNDQGFPVDTLGAFPTTDAADPGTLNNLIIQSDLAYSPTHEKLVIASKSWNGLDIYSLDGKNSINLKAPIKDDIKFVTNSVGDNTMVTPAPLWFTFSDVKPGPDSFVVGSILVKVEKEDDFDRNINSILEFDWDGNPLHKYNLAEETTTFDVDFKNGYIYYVVNRPDPIVVRSSIPKQ